MSVSGLSVMPLRVERLEQLADLGDRVGHALVSSVWLARLLSGPRPGGNHPSRAVPFDGPGKPCLETGGIGERQTRPTGHPVVVIEFGDLAGVTMPGLPVKRDMPLAAAATSDGTNCGRKTGRIEMPSTRCAAAMRSAQP